MVWKTRGLSLLQVLFRSRGLVAFQSVEFRRRRRVRGHRRMMRCRCRHRGAATEVLYRPGGVGRRGREITVRREQRRVMLHRLEVTVSVGDLQLGRQLLLPLGPPVLEPRLNLHLGQVQRLGQFHSFAHAQVLVRLEPT